MCHPVLVTSGSPNCKPEKVVGATSALIAFDDRKKNDVQDKGSGIIDTACRVSVCGSKWYNGYKRTLTQIGLLNEISETQESENIQVLEMAGLFRAT